MSAPFPEDVADYLKNNPGFFEQYADLMAPVSYTHLTLPTNREV